MQTASKTPQNANQVSRRAIETLLGRVIKNSGVEYARMSQGDRGKIVFHDIKQGDYRKSKPKMESMLNMRGLNKIDCYNVSASYKDGQYRMTIYANNISVVEGMAKENNI